MHYLILIPPLPSKFASNFLTLESGAIELAALLALAPSRALSSRATSGFHAGIIIVIVPCLLASLTFWIWYVSFLARDISTGSRHVLLGGVACSRFPLSPCHILTPTC